MNKVICLFVSIIITISLVACSMQSSNGLQQELRNNDQVNEQFPGDNHVIEWSDSAFEELVRIGEYVARGWTVEPHRLDSAVAGIGQLRR